MKRIILVLLLLCAYIWSASTGRDHFMISQGKKVYEMVMAWMEDAEVDFQIKQDPPPSPKKKSRRWD